LRLAGDAKLTLSALTECLRGRRQPWPEMVQAIAGGADRHAEEIATLLIPKRAPIRPERLMAELQPGAYPTTLVVADASYSTVWWPAIASLAPGMRLSLRGPSRLGWGFPMALGAKVARPSSPVLCVTATEAFATSGPSLRPLFACAPRSWCGIQQRCARISKRFRGRKVLAGYGRCYFCPVDHAQIARRCGCRDSRVSDWRRPLREPHDDQSPAASIPGSHSARNLSMIDWTK